MASYAEIADLMKPAGDQGLRGKIMVATLVAVDAIRLQADDATAAVRGRKRFAQALYRFVSAQNEAFHADFERVFRAVLVANKDATLAQIVGASDAAIQTAVNDAITFFAASFPDPAPVV